MALPETSARIEARGIPFHVVRVGRGPAVLVLPGGPHLGHTYLRPGLDALASDVELVYFDQRGSGETPVGDAARLSVDSLLDDIDALISALGWERASLIGHSAAADLAVLYAQRRPERVRSLVLLSAGPPFTEDLGERMGAAYMKGLHPDDVVAMAEIERSAAFAAREPATVEAYVRHQFTPFFRDRATALAMRYGLTATSAANMLGAESRWLREFPAHDPVGRLGRITAPTLVVHARYDPIPAAFAEQLRDGIPGARYVYLEGSSHFAYHEDPALLRDTVVPFLREQAAE